MTLAHARRGTGHPLVLLHGIGSHRQVWDPVVTRMRRDRETIAVDLPGFGESAPLPGGVRPTSPALADAVAAFLDAQGLERPDVAGNSLGGQIALELARRGRVRAAIALSPAGFWTARERTYAIRSLAGARAAARALGDRVDVVARSAVLRTAATWQLAARGWRQPPDALAAALRNLATSPGWPDTLDELSRSHFAGGRDVRGDVTVAWGERDRLLLPVQAGRARRAIPQARHVTLRGCGHVPTWDDPEQVARVVLLGGSA